MKNTIGEDFYPCEAVFTCTTQSNGFPPIELEARKKFHYVHEAEEWGLKMLEEHPDATNKYLGITRI